MNKIKRRDVLKGGGAMLVGSLLQNNAEAQDQSNSQSNTQPKTQAKPKPAAANSAAITDRCLDRCSRPDRAKQCEFASLINWATTTRKAGMEITMFRTC